MVDLLLSFALGVPAAYVLRSLILERTTSHEGPFKSNHLRVVFPEVEDLPEHSQAVAFFDYIRLLFGVYKRSGKYWIVQYGQAERFTCPFCLSFWVAYLFSIPAVIIFELNPILWVPVHLGIASASQIIYKHLFD